MDASGPASQPPGLGAPRALRRTTRTPRWRSPAALGGFDAELVAAALTSRGCARRPAKLGDFADGMLFTPEGLRRRPAHGYGPPRGPVPAGRLDALRTSRGIGADSLRSPGWASPCRERDRRVSAALATVNLRHFSTPGAARRRPRARPRGRGVDAVFADPARRTRSGARRHDPRAYAALDDVLVVRDACRSGSRSDRGSRTPRSPGAEAQWVSVTDRGQAGLWFGARPRRTWALRARAARGHRAHARRGRRTRGRRAPRGLPLRARRRGDPRRARRDPRDAPRGPPARPDDRVRDVRGAVVGGRRSCDGLPRARLDAVQRQAAARLPARARRDASPSSAARP